jgi:hypothetical protein
VLSIGLPADLEVGKDIELECVVRGGNAEQRYGLGSTTAAAR